VLYSVRDFFAENREVNGAQISSLWRVCRIYSELCQALDNVYDTLYGRRPDQDSRIPDWVNA
jgi:hypothetical protein